MKKRKTLAGFVMGLALLGASAFIALPSCQSSGQSQKAVTVVSLKVTGAKTDYFVGEKFSKTGMTVIAVKSDGTEEEVTDYYFSPSKALKATDTVVTIFYDEVSFELPITVSAKAISGLTLDLESVQLEVNGKHQIVTTVLPEDATEKGCTYASSDENIATVNDAGLITGKGVGTTKVTVTTKGLDANGKAISKEINVTIIATATTGLDIDVDDITLLKGEEKQIGVTVLPTNATNKEVTYTSSNPAVASVSNTGLVKALTEGESTITVSTVAKGTNGLPFTQSFLVTVIDANTKFAVAFRNTDGTLIQGYKAEAIEEGTVPAFTAKAPRKASDAEGFYIFRGFDKEIVPYVAGSEEITYTAVYQKRQYTITAASLALDGDKLVYTITGTSVMDNPQVDMRSMIKGGDWNTITVKPMEALSYNADGSWNVKANLLDPDNSFLTDSLGTIFIGKFQFNNSGDDEDLKELIRNDALRYRHTATGEVIEIKEKGDDWDGIDGYDDLSEEFKNAIPAPTWDGLNISYEETKVEVNGFEYKLFANADTWNCVSLIANKAGALDADVKPTSADVELIGDKPYYVVNGTFTGSYTIDQYQKAYGINLQHHGNIGWTDWDYVLGNKTVKFDFDKDLSTFNTETHEFTAKFYMDPALFPISVDGVFLVHSVLNGAEVDNLKVTPGTNVIKAGGHQYEILCNGDTWTICCLKVTTVTE